MFERAQPTNGLPADQWGPPRSGYGARKGVLFDPDRRAEAPALKSATGTLAVELERRELEVGLRQRKRKRENVAPFRLAVEALVCNFVFLRLAKERRPLAVPRGSDTMWSANRYAPRIYGSHFLDALAIMEHPAVAVIRTVARGGKFPGSQGTRTVIEATGGLFEFIPATAMSWEAIGREAPREVLVLKGPKPAGGEAQEIEYRETETTKRLRREVEALNRTLATAPVFLLPGTESGLGLGEDGQPIDPSRRYLRRIFNNGVWNEGGRLFDGFWESMPRIERFKRLRIGTQASPSGEQIANVDYGQLFPRLAYMLARQPAPAGDLYDIFGDGTARPGVKKLLNALLFARQPIKHWPRETAQLFPEGMKLHDAITAMERRHEAISHLFGTGVGFKLMFVESQVLLRALLALRKERITALPLHDSVLVALSCAERAKELLTDAIEELTLEGFRAVVTIDQYIEN